MIRDIRTSKPKTIQVSGGTLQVSDPCYDGDVKLENVRNGRWNVTSVLGTVDSWGRRNLQLVAMHEDLELEPRLVDTDLDQWDNPEYLGLVGVDSGQMAISADGKFAGSEGHEEWYDQISEITCATEGERWGVVDNTVVSSSGYGDGAYDLWVLRNTSNEIVGVCVEFIDIEEDEDSEEEDLILYDDEDDDLED